MNSKVSKEFVVNPEDTETQIETAKELLKLVEKYVDEKEES